MTPAIIYIPTTVTQGISADRSVAVYLAENVRGEVKIVADSKDFTAKEIDQRLNRFPLDIRDSDCTMSQRPLKIKPNQREWKSPTISS